VRAWRLVRPARGSRAEAFSGEGARLFGGRWNSVGVPVVYVSSTLALAALETLVHADRTSLTRDWASFEIVMPEDAILELRDEDLPADWRATPVSPGARSVGDAWIAEAASAALSVPSAIVPVERNYLLNPAHADFETLEIRGPRAFRFDDRLTGAPSG
jgi:RES domain-containing protein